MSKTLVRAPRVQGEAIDLAVLTVGDIIEVGPLMSRLSKENTVFQCMEKTEKTASFAATYFGIHLGTALYTDGGLWAWR